MNIDQTVTLLSLATVTAIFDHEHASTVETSGVLRESSKINSNIWIPAAQTEVSVKLWLSVKRFADQYLATDS